MSFRINELILLDAVKFITIFVLIIVYSYLPPTDKRDAGLVGYLQYNADAQ